MQTTKLNSPVLDISSCPVLGSPSNPVLGRLAPSPSGRMHLGNIFAALIAWVSAKSQGGKILLRIEDLDPRTQTADWSKILIEDLHWMGLDWDIGPIYQRDRIDVYAEALAKLKSMGVTYPCFCTRSELHAASAPHATDGTPIYNGTCKHLTSAQIAQKSSVRNPAIRLEVPPANCADSNIAFDDLVYGRYEQNLAKECGDFLVQRSDGIFAYQLAVSVDDAQMGVTEVVRGNDLLSSTPRQIYIMQLLDYQNTREQNIRYAHIPLLMSQGNKRLSKRDHACGLDELKSRFKNPQNIIGFLAYACSLTTKLEPMLAKDLASIFDWETLSKTPHQIYVADKLESCGL